MSLTFLQLRSYRFFLLLLFDIDFCHNHKILNFDAKLEMNDANMWNKLSQQKLCITNIV